MRLRLFLILAATAVLLAVVLWDLDWSLALEAIGSASPRWIGLIFVFYLGAHLVRGLRLRVLIDEPLSLRRLFVVNAVGYLAINLVPFRLGEMVRPYMLFRDDGVPFGRGMAALFIERLLDMTALLAMLWAVAFVVDLPEGGLIVAGVDVISVGQRSAAAIVMVGSLGGLVLVLGGEPVFRLLERLPVVGGLTGFGRRFREGFSELARAPLRFVALVAHTALIWMFVVLGVWASLSAFAGLDHSVGGALFTWTITLAGTAAIPTPGFFGSYELACAAALYVLGTNLDLARIVAVAVHLFMFGFTVILGIIVVIAEGLDFGALVKASQGAATEPEPEPEPEVHQPT